MSTIVFTVAAVDGRWITNVAVLPPGRNTRLAAVVLPLAVGVAWLTAVIVTVGVAGNKAGAV